jgi:hypothetical protein
LRHNVKCRKFMVVIFLPRLFLCNVSLDTFYFLFLFVFKHKKVRDIQDYNSVRIFPNTITDNKASFIRLQAIL